MGTVPADIIADRLNAEFGQARSAHAVRCRANLLGLSVVPSALTAQSVALICGVDDKTVYRWIRRGWLANARCHQPNAQYLITGDALEQFLRVHRAQVDYRQMLRGQWRNLIESLQRVDPLWTIPQTCAYLGVGATTLRRALREGRLPGELRSKRGRGQWVVPRSVAMRYAPYRLRQSQPERAS